MTFLSPWSAVLAGVLTLPLLLLLYFLKLRRQPRSVGSTLLWRKSIEDLQVNAPFQKLRTSLLFFLQLLALLLFVGAMGEPVMDDELGSSTRLIILIDRSASMQAELNTADDSQVQTRLQLAKKLSIELSDRFLKSHRTREVMVIAFGRRARVISGFQTDRREVERAIESIQPSDETADLAAALQLASAFATSTEEAETTLPRMAIVSDGSVGQPEASIGSFVAQADDVQFVRVGQALDSTRPMNNIGIVSLDARRNLDEPSKVDLFARFINTTTEAATTVLTLRIDGEVRAVQSIDIPPTEMNADGISRGEVGEVVQSFEFALPDGGLVTLSQGTRDLLPGDDVASVVIPPPAQPTIAMVSDKSTPDPLILNLLAATEPKEVLSISSEEFAASREIDQTADGPDVADFFVFDRSSVDRLPDQPSLHFGSFPPAFIAKELSDQPEGSSNSGRRIISWDRRHPLMRHITLDDVIFSGITPFEIPASERDQWDVLASSKFGPAIVASKIPRNGPHVFVGFELRNSNWLTQVSLLVFIQNILDAASLGQSANDGRSHRPGDTVDIDLVSQADVVEIAGPIVTEVEVSVDRDRMTLPLLPLAGVYSITNATPDTIAMNIASVEESDIRPKPDVVVNAQSADVNSATKFGSRQLWPWFVAAGLVILMLEWWLYTKRTRI